MVTFDKVPSTVNAGFRMLEATEDAVRASWTYFNACDQAQVDDAIVVMDQAVMAYRSARQAAGAFGLRQVIAYDVAEALAQWGRFYADKAVAAR